MLIGKFGAVKDEDPVLPPATLYGGEVQIRFDPVAHRYTVNDVRVNDGAPFSPPSVTRVLSAMIDKSEPLVSWATRVSREKVIELVQPDRTYTAEEIQRISYEVQGASKAVVKAACDTGHDFHEWTQNYLLFRLGQRGFPTPPENVQVLNCCRAAQKSIKKVDLKPFSIERILYSREYGVIGTADVAALSTVSGRTAIIDWKSSRDLHHSYRFQTAIYRHMLHEMTGIWTDDRWLIRVEKNPIGDDPGFHPLLLPPEDADADTEAFLGMLKGFRRLKILEEAA